jgi:hypothetical protein
MYAPEYIVCERADLFIWKLKSQLAYFTLLKQLRFA